MAFNLFYSSKIDDEHYFSEIYADCCNGIDIAIFLEGVKSKDHDENMVATFHKTVLYTCDETLYKSNYENCVHNFIDKCGIEQRHAFFKNASIIPLPLSSNTVDKLPLRIFSILHPNESYWSR